jgi:hypothetical protein
LDLRPEFPALTRYVPLSLDSATFEVQFVRPARSGNAKTLVFTNRATFFQPLRFICVIRVIRGKNAIVLLTTDRTDFTDRVAGPKEDDA